MPYLSGKQPKALLENTVAMHPLELVHLNYLYLRTWERPGREWFSGDRHAQAYVTQSQTTQTMAKALWDNFIIHYGLPKKILLDQGRNFESELVADFCKLMGTQKL